MSYIKSHKSELILLLVLCLFTVLMRLPYLEKPLDEDSAANAYGGRLILQGEPLYSSYHPGHHLPAVYYTYALAFFLFGDSAEAVRFFLALWMIPTICLLYYLSRTFADKKTSCLAVILFVLLSSDYALEGHTAEIELFANLPRIAATLLLIKLMERKGGDWQFSFIGLVGAIAILFKAVYISPLLLAGFILLIQFWTRRYEKDATRTFLRRTFWMGAGFIGGLLPAVIYFGTLGLLPRIALVFTLGQIHVSSTPVSLVFIFLYPLSGLALANMPLLALGLAGALLVALDKTSLKLPKNIILLWFFISFVEAGFSRNPFMHYYQLISPPLSLLAAWAITYVYQVESVYPKIKQVAWIVPVLALFAIGGAYFFINGGYLYHYMRYKTGKDTYRTFVSESWPPTGPITIALYDIANYIQAHSKPDDRIFIWSDETQLYYLTQRRCAVDFIWPIFVNLAPIPGGQEEMQRRLLASTTKFIVISQENPPTWLVDGLTQNYRLVETISNRKIYQRLDNSEQAVQN